VPSHGLLIDTATGQEIGPPAAYSPQGAFTADGQKLLVLSYPALGPNGSILDRPQKAQLLDAATGKAHFTMDDLPGRFVAVSPDGRHVLMAFQEKAASNRGKRHRLDLGPDHRENGDRAQGPHRCHSGCVFPSGR